MAMLQQENIRSFIVACRVFGMMEFELFAEKDLFLAQNLPQVVTCIHAFARYLLILVITSSIFSLFFPSRRVCALPHYNGPKVEVIYSKY